MAGTATRESLTTLFGQKALNKAGFLFPYVSGSIRDIEPVDYVRGRAPIVLPTKMAAWTAALANNTISKYVTVTASKMETHLDLGDDEMREGGVIIDQGVQGMVKESFQHWDDSTIAAWEANGNAFDSVAYFSADHYINGASGTKQSNSLTADVADNTNKVPTSAEAAAIVDDIVAALYDMKDLNGNLVNQDMREVVIVCPNAKTATAFRSAVATPNGSLSASSSVNLGLKVSVVQKAGIAAGNVYGVRADADGRAMILQECAPETRLTPSDARNPLNRFNYNSDRGVALGLYYYVVKAVLS